MSTPRRLTLGAVTAALVAVPLALAAPSAAASQSYATSGSKIAVVVRGNGHGHGMSQYGAQGAAIAGKTYKQIAAFYYPHTSLLRNQTATVRRRSRRPGSGSGSPAPGARRRSPRSPTSP